MAGHLAVSVSDLSHRYGRREALSRLTLRVPAGRLFALLGPNGSGKTTLFRILCTLIPVQLGNAEVLGFDLRSEPDQVRRRIGVVFQAPSLDEQLTVSENIRHQAALYGLRGPLVRRREQMLLDRLDLADRAGQRAATLSGGLRRRAELAKGMIHLPQLLLMDEPSTGLDPAARRQLWRILKQLRDQLGVTIVLTTHLLEEADKADRIAILDQGRLVACDSPDALRRSVRGDAIMIRTSDAELLAADIRQRFQIEATVVEGQVRLEQPDGAHWIARLAEAFPDRIDAVRIGKPTLEDVFIDKTGHRFDHLPDDQGP